MGELPHMQTRIVKVGGSLLDDSGLPEKLGRFLDASPGFRHVIIVGGDGLVNCVRHWHWLHELSEEFCHWSSVRLMSETARLLGQLCPRLPVVESISDLPSQKNVILDCQSFLKHDSNLQRSWQTTSDSIAAEIARVICADELWLLKSILPGSASVANWQDEGIVDDNFCEASSSQSTIFVANLTTANFVCIKGT